MPLCCIFHDVWETARIRTHSPHPVNFTTSFNLLFQPSFCPSFPRSLVDHLVPIVGTRRNRVPPRLSHVRKSAMVPGKGSEFAHAVTVLSHAI